jgi:uncharacterized membrane protein
MNSQSSIEINAPASEVWAVFADVEHWPEWTASVDRVTALDGAAVEVGKRFEIKQPRLPRLVWEVTDVVPGSGWTWRQQSPGATSLAIHEVVATAAEQTLVRQSIEQRGPLGVVNGLLMRPLIRRYLRLEAEGLKARVEHESGVDVASA